jgi:hypothetical protein
MRTKIETGIKTEINEIVNFKEIVKTNYKTKFFFYYIFN